MSCLSLQFVCYFLPLPGIRTKEQTELYLAASSSHTVHSPLEHDVPRDQVNLGKRWRQIHLFTHEWEPVQPEMSTRPNEDLGTADWWARDMMPPFRPEQLPAKKKNSAFWSWSQPIQNVFHHQHPSSRGLSISNRHWPDQVESCPPFHLLGL